LLRLSVGDEQEITMKMLFVILALTTLAIANPAMAQYSAPYSVPGYNWHEQRGSQDWRTNTWREQQFDQDWRNNQWRQQRANEDWQQREKYMKKRTPNDATDTGSAEDKSNEKE